MTTTEDRAVLRADDLTPEMDGATLAPRAGRLALILGAFVALGPLTIDTLVGMGDDREKTLQSFAAARELLA